jgi:predicted enzyme related to lactoylglutathione lyase
MPEITKHVTGMFSWADMGTTDVPGAKKFYSGLFGWTYQDDPMGPDSVYSRALSGGKDVCAIYPQQADQAKQGIPPYWASYITVESADALAQKAASLGGKAMMPPFDVFDAGRMVVVQDPSGAAIAGWEPRKHIGARVMNEPGALCWTELMTTNVEAAGKFYASAFGWKPESMAMPTGTYTVFKVAAQSAAGMMQLPAEMKGIPPHWLIYFAVQGCDDTVAKARSSGGEILAPPANIPNVGRFAVIKDPFGATFGILQPAS